MKKRELRVWFALSLLALLLIFLLIYSLPSSNYFIKKSAVTGFATYELTQCANAFNTGYGYYLSSNLVTQGSYCFFIDAPDIEINCQGHSITNYKTNAIGIFSYAPNTTIRNCIIRTNISSGTGIQFNTGANQGTIINNTLDKNAKGINIYSEGNNITQNIFIDNYIPIQVRSEPDNNIYNNIIIDKKIRECKDITTKGNYILFSNISADNTRQICLNITTPDVVINCQGYSITNNNANAIAINTNNLNITIRNCVISTNISSGTGIKFNAQATRGFIINNTIKNNYRGIYINSNSNSISDNILSNNAKSIFIESDTEHNLLSGNNFGSSPKVYFKFNEYNNNDNFIDSASPNGLGGTPIPNKRDGPKSIVNPSASAGDRYAVFNGNNYINVSEFRQLISPNSPITVMFWAQASADNIDKKAALFSVDINSLNNPRQFAAYLPWEDSKLYWDYGNLSKGRINYDYQDDFGNMAHVALVSGGINGNFKAIYMDGNLVESESNSSSPDNNFGKLIIGCIPNYKTGSSTSAYCYKGALDDFMIYDRIVEGEEIQQIYTSQASKFTDDRFYNSSDNSSANNLEHQNSQTIEITPNDLRTGKSVSLNVGDEIQLTISNEYYYLILDLLTSSKARFFVDYDEEINFTIDINKTAKFDFDADDTYDLSIKFVNTSLGNTRASFFLKTISEPITGGSSGNARNTGGAGGNSGNNDGASNEGDTSTTSEEESANSGLTNINNATGNNNKKTLPSYLFILVIASFIVLIIILIIWIYLEVTKGKGSDTSAIGISFSKYDNFRKPSF